MSEHPYDTRAAIESQGGISAPEMVLAFQVADEQYVARLARHGRRDGRVGSVVVMLDVPEILELAAFLRDPCVSPVLDALREQLDAIVESIQKAGPAPA